MKTTFLKSLCVTLFLLSGSASIHAQAPNSALSKVTSYKIAVDHDGVYRISYDLLKKMGINPDEIDPGHLHLYGNPGGMPPQANDAQRPYDLLENAIFVSGESDGQFNKEDFILFYGEGATKTTFDTKRNIFAYRNNLYSDRNFYFLSVDDTAGKRISESINIDGTFAIVNQFDDFAVHELEETNLLKSGREWFGEVFKNETPFSLTFNVSGIVPGSDIKIVSDLMGRCYSAASMKLSMNGIEVAQQNIPTIIRGTYVLQGSEKRDTVVVNETTVSASARDNQQITYEFNKTDGPSEAFLDYVLVNFKRTLSLYGNQTIFTSSASLQNAVSTFQIAKGNISVWDITTPGDAQNQIINSTNDLTVFSTETTTLKKFIAFNADVPAPDFIEKVELQDLHGMSTPNLLIITHPTFESEALRLAEHRENFSHWTTQVVTVEKIYNEFSSGRQDVTALRDFIKLLYDKSPGTLKAVLLFGRGSYDYKDRVIDNTNFVPTYESRNSLHELQTYSSDDFFGFMESTEGEWSESPAKNHTLDIGVGRLPVRDGVTAKNIVDKIIRYDTSRVSMGYWRKKIFFVADDGSFSDGWTSLHQVQANSLADLVLELEPGVDTRKLFMGTYHKQVNAGSESVKDLSEDIRRAFASGAMIINFTGHGGEKQWTDESILTNADIEQLDNKTYPFLVTATCQFGRNDQPGLISGAELAVTQKNGGAIGLVTTARPVNATTNFDLNKAFYQALFEDNEAATIGDVFMKTKNNSASGVANRNFSLLCDPSLILEIPGNSVVVTSIKTENGSDTLKALSKVILTGEVHDYTGNMIDTFNGTVEAQLFDKQTDFVTIGRNNPQFQFNEWHNVLFHGQATVKSGVFEMSFIVPKNISYSIANGRMSFYAYDPAQIRDAKGGTSAFKIGGSETSPPSDNTTPSIKAYIGDTTFVNGDVTSPDTWLIVRLADANGINISDYGIGNSLLGILDDDVETYILNQYYIADRDNYSKGWVRFPLRNLAAGRHRITVKAWDVFNNPAEAAVDFFVTDGDEILVQNFGNYPNPFTDRTTLFFTHNRSGDDLKASVFIYSPTGSLLTEAEISIAESDYHINLIEIDNSGDTGKKLPAGLYLARLVVRSLTNGSKNERVTKLIILN